MKTRCQAQYNGREKEIKMRDAIRKKRGDTKEN